MHVTLRSGLRPLRTQHVFPTLRIAMARATNRAPDRFRILHYSIQRDHIHLIVEASDRRSLSAGMRGLAIRMARYVNQLLSRRGPLWADRWHGRALATPRSVRTALRYVLANHRKHAREEAAGVDPFSSGLWFDGWRDEPYLPSRAPPLSTLFGPHPPKLGDPACPISRPRSSLGTVLWRRAGLILVDERPAHRKNDRARRA